MAARRCRIADDTHATSDPAPHQRPHAPPHVTELLGRDECVVLDGATGTEIPRLGDSQMLNEDEALWGTRALIDQPDAVLAVHRRYAAVGCDVISTNTWGLPSALRDGGPQLWRSSRPVHWMDVARRGVRLAREAIAAEGRASECAVAFSVNADLDGPGALDTVHLLSRMFADEPPDLVLFETLSLVRPSLFSTVQALLDSQVPVWLSFRRCRQGLCGVFGQHWGGPEGDAFGRAARRLEEMGVSALRRTMELLAQHDLTCAVADFEFFPITEHFAEAMPQIEKVIAQSDAYLLDIGGSRSIVAYLLEVRHA